MDKSIDNNMGLEKTKQKIKRIGKVSNVILIIFSVITLIVAFGTAVMGAVMLTVTNTMSDEEMISHLNSFLNENTSSDNRKLSMDETEKHELKQELIESIDNVSVNYG